MKLGKIIISKEQIQSKVKEIAQQIKEDYKDKSLSIICVLKGAIFFLNDLVKYLTDMDVINIDVDYIKVKSYENTKSTGKIDFKKDITINVKDKEVLIVEDIIDTNLTIKYLIDYFLNEKGAKRVKVCTFLNKLVEKKFDYTPTYLGYEIEDIFVVGYGLDCNDKYRLEENIFECIED